MYSLSLMQVDDMPSSSLGSSTLRDILAHNAALNREMQEALVDSMRDITKSAKRQVVYSGVLRIILRMSSVLMLRCCYVR